MYLICFSHLRWDFVYQRPQHILTRFAKKFKVLYIEEAVFFDGSDSYSSEIKSNNINVIVPKLNSSSTTICTESRLQILIYKLFSDFNIIKYIMWYYTPMALSFTQNLKPDYVVFDCMDELSAFKFAPKELKLLEKKLFSIADIVFTGGNALFDAKKNLHNHIFSFPSSIDKEHFGAARNNILEPNDQIDIPHPRLGFFGVIDERFDIDLIKKVAIEKPDWHFVLIGPTVKIDPNSLPQSNNIHYLGSKKYQELPTYLSSWDIALIPFQINESTQFISPTKTPEYLAAGKPVVSSAIKDVVHPYGDENLVHIYYSTNEFIAQVDQELQTSDKLAWLEKVDHFLSTISWDITCEKMINLITTGIEKKNLIKYK